MDVWIRHPRLWAAAAEKTARDTPKYTKAFWKRIVSYYLSLGGKLEESETESE